MYASEILSKSPLLTGIGSVFSIGGNYFAVELPENDAIALGEDWKAIGDDMRLCMKSMSAERMLQEGDASLDEVIHARR